MGPCLTEGQLSAHGVTYKALQEFAIKKQNSKVAIQTPSAFLVFFLQFHEHET